MYLRYTFWSVFDVSTALRTLVKFCLRSVDEPRDISESMIKRVYPYLTTAEVRAEAEVKSRFAYRAKAGRHGREAGYASTKPHWLAYTDRAFPQPQLQPPPPLPIKICAIAPSNPGRVSHRVAQV